MHFRVSEKSKFEQIHKYVYVLICNSEKTKNDINAWKSNILKMHCSCKLPIKHIAQLNSLYKLLIT